MIRKLKFTIQPALLISLALLILTIQGCNQSTAQTKTETKQETPTKTEITELLKTSKCWNGDDLPKYPDGKPEVTILKAVIPPKTKLDIHKHPVINAIVLTKGEWTIVTDKNEKIQLKAGDAYTEVVNSWHYGENNGSEPTEGFIFYAGVEGIPITVPKQKS